MASIDTLASGRSGARDIRVWDPLVRLIHWSLALIILVNGALTEGESDLHHLLGYVAIGLVATRLLWGLIGSRHARFSSFPPDPFRALRHIGDLMRGDRTVHLSHNPLGALMVYNIWGTVIAMGVTGYMMGTMQFFGVEWVEKAHELAFDWLLLSVAVHVAAVAFETWRSGVPLVPAMFHGRKRVPEGTITE